VAVADGGEDRAREEDGLAEGPVGRHREVADGGDAPAVGLDDARDEVLQVGVGQALLVALQELVAARSELVDQALLVRVLDGGEDGGADEQVD